MVIQSQPSAAGSKDSIFFAQVIDSILLLLVHPAGHSDENEPEGVKDFRCFSLQGLLLCTWRPVRQDPDLSTRSNSWTQRDRYNGLCGLRAGACNSGANRN